MSSILGSIGSFFSGGGGQALSAGLAGAGEIGNLITSGQRNSQINELLSQEKANANISPTDLANRVSAATQPLSQGLIQSVNNSVQGDMASRGLAEAPGIFAATEEQALAPFIQQNQQTALQLVLKQLGLPLDYAQAILGALPQQSNLSPLLALLMRQNNPSGGSSNLPSGSWDFLNTMFPNNPNSSDAADVFSDFPTPGL